MTTEVTNNVISLFGNKKDEKETEKEASESSFAEVLEKNKKIKEKMEKERMNDNKKVLRSYRIKN